jgi:large subunit ribosomal protein L18
MRSVQKRFDLRSLRVRSKISKVSDRFRLCVTKSNRHIYAQVISDKESRTIVAFSTMSKEIRSEKKSNCNREKAVIVGKRIGELAKDAGITEVAFDRGGFRYQGVIKEAADAARLSLKF